MPVRRRGATRSWPAYVVARARQRATSWRQPAEASVSSQEAGAKPEGGWELAGAGALRSGATKKAPAMRAWERKHPPRRPERVVVVRGGLEPPNFRFSGRLRSLGSMEPVLQSKARRSARMVAVATCCGPGCGHQIRALVYGGQVAEPADADCVLRRPRLPRRLLPAERPSPTNPEPHLHHFLRYGYGVRRRPVSAATTARSPSGLPRVTTAVDVFPTSAPPGSNGP